MLDIDKLKRKLKLYKVGFRTPEMHYYYPDNGERSMSGCYTINPQTDWIIFNVLAENEIEAQKRVIEHLSCIDNCKIYNETSDFDDNGDYIVRKHILVYGTKFELVHLEEIVSNILI